MSSAGISEAPYAVSKPRFSGAIWALLLLSPFIGELLSGSTRTSFLFVFIPEVMVWGVGALLCRELVRRWRAGGVSLLMLGLALSIAEEFIIQQTSIAPLPFPGSHPDYARLWGVNLVYLLFMLGYESVWVVVIPVQVTELFFPQHSRLTWLRLRGIIIACIVFLVGSRIAWYGWTQQARPRMNAAPYHPPLAMIVLGFAAIAALIAIAYLVRNVGLSSPGDQRRAAPAWVGGLMAFVMGAAWFALIAQYFIPKPVQPSWIPIVAGAGWAALAFALFVWWSSRRAWGETHRLASTFGGTLACMVVPYLSMASWSKIDVIGKIVFDILALVSFALLARNVLAQKKSGVLP
ncbi:MAG TPA: hypothetical protein VJO35_02930 [Terriglobales bacterium]|nr:hypothetical protein [Terriglobales bacterium]